jgi:hypothetical protein
MSDRVDEALAALEAVQERGLYDHADIDLILAASPALLKLARAAEQMALTDRMPNGPGAEVALAKITRIGTVAAASIAVLDELAEAVLGQ